MATKSRNLLSETKGLSCYAPRADVSACMARVDLVEKYDLIHLRSYCQDSKAIWDLISPPVSLHVTYGQS